MEGAGKVTTEESLKMALMEISVVPLGTQTTSLSPWIAKVVRAVQESGLDYTLHDMGTTIKGGAGELLELAARLHEVPFSQGARRVYTVIKLDDRRDKDTGLGDKSASVRKRLEAGA